MQGKLDYVDYHKGQDTGYKRGMRKRKKFKSKGVLQHGGLSPSWRVAKRQIEHGKQTQRHVLSQSEQKNQLRGGPAGKSSGGKVHNRRMKEQDRQGPTVRKRLETKGIAGGLPTRTAGERHTRGCLPREPNRRQTQDVNDNH